MVKSLGEVIDKDVPNTVHAPYIHKDDSEALIGAGFDLNEIIKEETMWRHGKVFIPKNVATNCKVDASGVDDKTARKQTGEKVSKTYLNE